MDANANTKKTAESPKPVDKSEAQPSTKKTEPEVLLILTFEVVFYLIASLVLYVFCFGLGGKEKGYKREGCQERKEEAC